MMTPAWGRVVSLHGSMGDWLLYSIPYGDAGGWTGPTSTPAHKEGLSKDKHAELVPAAS